MGQIVSSAAKPKRCNANQLSQVPTPAAGEHILVSSDNSMNAAGQGNFDCYIVGVGNVAATELPLHTIADEVPTYGSKNSVSSGGIYNELLVADTLTLQSADERNLRPYSTGKIVASGNGYTKVTPVRNGKTYTITFSIVSGTYLRYGFTQDYPEVDVAVTGYGDLNSSKTTLTLTAPFDGYLVAECGSDYNSFEVTTKQDDNAIGKKVYDLNHVVGEVARFVTPKNKFNKNDYNILNATVNSSTNKIAANASLRTIYVEIKPSTQYTVSKMVSARFIIGFTSEIPANGIDCTGVTYNNNAASLTSTSASNSKYLCVTCYFTTEENSLETILATLQIEEGSSATGYEDYFAPYYTAIDSELRSEASETKTETDGKIAQLKLLDSQKDEVTFGNRFNKLSDKFIDTFLTRSTFVDETHPYTKWGTGEPTITTGSGAYVSGASELSMFTRNFDHFPVYFTAGVKAGYRMMIVLKVTGIWSGEFVQIQFDDSVGSIRLGSTIVGYLDELTKWLFFRLMEDGIDVWDDAGNHVHIDEQFSDSDPMNYGLYFGKNYDYGVMSFAEWKVCELDSLNISRLANLHESTHSHNTNTLRYARSYKLNGERKTDYDADVPSTYVGLLSSSSPIHDYTNNPIIRAAMSWGEDNTYRCEAGITGSLLFDGALERHRVSVDYYIPSATNPESPVAAQQYETYIMQVHDTEFATENWSDPPPVYLTHKGGKLYATVCYIANGEIPTGNSVVIRDTYYLCDVPDGWFNVKLEVRTACLDGLDPSLIISVNGVEKLNISTQVGYNIYPDGGKTRVTFGIYCPGWTYTDPQEYGTREIYITNVKYEY